MCRSDTCFSASRCCSRIARFCRANVRSTPAKANELTRALKAPNESAQAPASAGVASFKNQSLIVMPQVAHTIQRTKIAKITIQSITSDVVGLFII
ncbi:hypothetical protein SPHINGOT1_80222 [Sphingomonas sp. T1]|nr:hypothetical protein SPHINGOT1_80222 [Sphingomonas sp. T1]